MEKRNNISVKMFRVEGDYAPLVKVNYMDKDAQEHSALMLLDSCSTVNILSSELDNCIGALCNNENEATNIITCNNSVITSNGVDFSFAFGGEEFHESFYMGNHHLPRIAGDLPIIGILGNKFMLKHNLVIDYSDFTIHYSDVSPENLSIADCDFFTPMGYGLVYYGIPVLPIVQGENQIFTMADTGASFNIIARQTIDDNGFDCQYQEEADSISGIGGSDTEAENAVVSFKLMTLANADNSINEVSYSSQFKVIPHYPFTLPQGSCDKNGNPLPPIQAIISSPFMAKEGWILDFGADIIYRRKSADKNIGKIMIKE